MNELAINWLRDNAPAFVKAAIDAQEDEIHTQVRATYDSVVADAWREKLAAVEAENGRLRQRVDDLEKSIMQRPTPAQMNRLQVENGRLRDALWKIIDLHPDASKMVLHAGETLERLKPSPAAKV